MLNVTGLTYNRFLPSLSELDELIPDLECGREFWHEVGNKLTLPARRIAELTSLFFTHSNKNEISSVGDALLALSSTFSGRAQLHRHGEILNNALQSINLESPISVLLKDSRLALPISLLKGLSEGKSLIDFLKTEHSQAAEVLVEALLKGKNEGSTQIIQAKRQEIKILSLNIWGVPTLSGFGSKDSSRFPQIADHLESGKWDVILLQEVWDPRSLTILHRLADKYNTYAPSVGKLYGRSGLAIFSKFPILESANHSFEDAKGIERYVKKGALFAKLDLGNGQDFDIATSHFTSPPESVNCALVSLAETEIQRCRNSVSLKKFLAKVRRGSSAPLIVGGDFNAEESGLAYDALGATFGDDLMRLRLPTRWNLHSSQIVHEKENTLLTFDPKKNHLAQHSAHRGSRYDYFFGDFNGRDALIKAALRFNTSGDTLSDHYGIELTVAL